MARLDYALHAEYARVDASGLLTVVGASFDRVNAPQLPAHQPIAIAMRLILSEEEKAVPWVIKWRDPSGLGARIESVAEQPENPDVVDGMVGLIVAVNAVLPILSNGLFRITIEIDQEERAVLQFEVVSPSTAQE